MYQIIVCCLIGYILGSFNISYWLSQLLHVDFRGQGSGNLGASNATMLLGIKAGIFVFLFDFFKVFAAVMLAGMIFPGNNGWLSIDPSISYARELTTAFAVLGHMFPFYLKFKGGKGFASYIGMTFLLNWQFAICVVIGIVLFAFVFDWIVAGTFFTISIVPIYLLITGQYIPACITGFVSLCIFLKHMENIKKKKKGKESGIKDVIFKKK